LKQQFSLNPNANQATTTATRPPRKRQATILDYDSAQTNEYPPLETQATNLSSTMTAVATTTASTTTAANECTKALAELKNEISLLKNSMTTTTKPAPTVDYAEELQIIKTELATLRSLITSAVDQMKHTVDSIKTNTLAPVNEMEIDDHSKDRPKDTTPELSDLISGLKNDIATIAKEMREKFTELRAPPKPIPFQLTPFPT